MDVIIATNDLDDDDEINKMNNFWNSSSSYILETYKIENESDINEDLMVLFATIAVLIIISYILLISKIRK